MGNALGFAYINDKRDSTTPNLEKIITNRFNPQCKQTAASYSTIIYTRYMSDLDGHKLKYHL